MEQTYTNWNATDRTWHIGRVDQMALYKGVLRYVFCATWLGIFGIVAIAFVTLSTPQQRRGPIFVIICITFPLAILYNILEVSAAYRRFDDTFSMPGDETHWVMYTRIRMTDLALEHALPLLADCGLIFKIRSFYPRSLYPKWKRFLVIAPLVILIFPRLGLTVAAVYASWQMEYDTFRLPGHVYPLSKGWNWVDLVKSTNQAEYSLEAVYCAYAAGILLHKAFSFTFGSSVQLRRSGLKRKMRFFIEALLMSFIPPVLFSITAAAVLACPAERYCYYREITGSLLNLSVLCLLLATSWSSIRSSHDHDVENEKKHHDHQQRQTFKDIQKIAMPGTLLDTLYCDDMGSANTDDEESFRKNRAINRGGRASKYGYPSGDPNRILVSSGTTSELSPPTYHTREETFLTSSSTMIASQTMSRTPIASPFGSPAVTPNSIGRAAPPHKFGATSPAEAHHLMRPSTGRSATQIVVLQTDTVDTSAPQAHEDTAHSDDEPRTTFEIRQRDR